MNNIQKLSSVGTPYYAHCGPRRTNNPRWVPATVIKVHGSRSVNVKVHPRGPVWRGHIEQLRPRYGVDEDSDPGLDAQDFIRPPSRAAAQSDPEVELSCPTGSQKISNVPQYGPHNTRRSTKIRRRKAVWDC